MPPACHTSPSYSPASRTPIFGWLLCEKLLIGSLLRPRPRPNPFFLLLFHLVAPNDGTTPPNTILLGRAFSLTEIRLWCHIWHHFYFELCDCLITFPIFVPSQRLIARNVRELFSFNRGVSHLNEACRIDDVSRGSLLCYEILTNN